MLTEIIDFIYPPRCAACQRSMPIGARKLICEACFDRIEWLTEPLCTTCGVPLIGGGIGIQESSRAPDSPRRPRAGMTSQEPEVSDEIAAESGQCLRCVNSPPHFSRARALARYRADSEHEKGGLGSIIRRHKYALDQALGRALIQFLCEQMPYRADDYDLVVPVPLHNSRLRWRGFNQAAILGRAVARDLGLPFDPFNLRRVRPTSPQTGHDHEARSRNVHAAFAVAKRDGVADRRVLLVDDVMTTGATANECARALRSAGAVRIDVLTLARVL